MYSPPDFNQNAKVHKVKYVLNYLQDQDLKKLLEGQQNACVLIDII